MAAVVVPAPDRQPVLCPDGTPVLVPRDVDGRISLRQSAGKSEAVTLRELVHWDKTRLLDLRRNYATKSRLVRGSTWRQKNKHTSLEKLSFSLFKNFDFVNFPLD